MPAASQDSREKKQKGYGKEFLKKLLLKEYKEKALKFKNDVALKMKLKENGTKGKVTSEITFMDDPEKQEKIWVKDLVEKIKNRIDI